MIKICRSENNDELNYWPDGGVVEPHFIINDPRRRKLARLSSLNIKSHDKHFIFMSHNGHVTTKWEGEEPPPLPLKGGRTIGRKRLLTGKMREN
jgi:hypothetical protein